MATCADCIHYEVCSDYFDATIECGSTCSFWKDRSRFMELPCAGDKVYEICCINPWGDCVIGEVDKNDTDFDSELLGKRFFLTPEEAEKALKERENNA